MRHHYRPNITRWAMWADANSRRQRQAAAPAPVAPRARMVPEVPITELVAADQEWRRRAERGEIDPATMTRLERSIFRKRS